MKRKLIKQASGLAYILCLMFLVSCSKRVNFITSGVVPAAEGHIKISKDDNQNYTVDVMVKRLAEPSRLQPPKEVYVVWMETKSNGLKNLGRLNSSSGFFSSGLEGLLHAVTPFKPERVFVTAEDKSNIPYPGSQVVLTTKVFN
ncbi:hypothetical protein ACFQZX_17490 [Mucilaginibacter litoreus]|uniref:Uncharacterized protein n=1 Tax=Mucilaginibacter litoreus TaxID=1048221 RepID=A0ABW3AX23_9SPHI